MFMFMLYSLCVVISSASLTHKLSKKGLGVPYIWCIGCVTGMLNFLPLLLGVMK